MTRTHSSKKELAPKQRAELLKVLKNRFEKNMNRHKNLTWDEVLAKLEANPEKLWSLNEMEITGGEPDVAGRDKKTGEYIICGDWNIAHKKIDLKNWQSNQKNSGFLPEERAWMDKLFNEIGYVDAFRLINQEPEQYTWWSNRSRAWEKNVGWRIDYQIITPGLKPTVKSATIYKDQRFSDHAPLVMEYDMMLRSSCN